MTLTGEIGGPLWKLGSQWYLPVSRGTRILAESRSAGTTLLWADPRTGAEHELDCPLDWLRIQDFDDATRRRPCWSEAPVTASPAYTFHVASGELHPVALEADVTDTSPWFSTPQLWSFDAVHTGRLSAVQPADGRSGRRASAVCRLRPRRAHGSGDAVGPVRSGRSSPPAGSASRSSTTPDRPASAATTGPRSTAGGASTTSTMS